MDRGRSGILRIVDRRFDSKNKSTVNRQRFLRRFKGQIREAVTNVINQRGVRDIDSGEKISIPARDISEPQFQHGRGGVWRRTLPGNDRFHSGDEIDRPDGGGGGSGSGKASNEGEGMDEFAFTLSREEFLELFFEDLALPNLVKTQLARIDEYQRIRAGYTQTGVPAKPAANAARLAPGFEAPFPWPAFAAALTDGEDFELLFTVAARHAVKLLDAWKTTFPNLKLSCIGKIVPGRGILIRDKTGTHQLNAHGYVHFA